MTTFGRELKKARIDKGWNQVTLAQATGLKQKHISALENDHGDPRWSTLARLAVVLDMSFTASLLATLRETDATP